MLLVIFVAAFPFLYAAQPFTWYWHDARYAIFLAPLLGLVLVSLVCEAGMWALGYAQSAPAIMAALALVAGLGLTLVAARGEQPYEPRRRLAGRRAHELDLVARQPEQPAHSARRFAAAMGRPLRLFELLARLRRRVPLRRPCHGEPAGPEFIRYPPYYRGDSGQHGTRVDIREPCARARRRPPRPGPRPSTPVAPRLMSSASLIPEIVEWCEAHHISYSMRYSGPYVVVIPSERVLPSQILPYYGM